MEEEGFPKWERYIRVRDNGILYYNICLVQLSSNVVLLYQGCPVLLLEVHFTAEFSSNTPALKILMTLKILKISGVFN